jgi:hypothetical protein
MTAGAGARIAASASARAAAVEGVAAAPETDPSRARVPGRMMRPVVGVLADGTPFFAPLGEVVIDDSRVTCHLCGRLFRSVSAHLASHGWTGDRYRETFGLERSQPLECADTRKLRSAAFNARLLFEPAVREGSAAGRERARSGELASQAARAARGRPFPEQRRRRTARARAAIPPEVIGEASRKRADRYLTEVATQVARQHGYVDLGAFVAARISAGASLAAISREAGLHKDWMSRHLERVDDAAAIAARQAATDRHDVALLQALAPFGYRDVAAYLREHHLERHQSVNAIAAAIGVSHHAVSAALRRHGLDRVAHAAKRHEASRRAAATAARLGYAAIADYVGTRRADGWTWKEIANESGQPQTWLRRHAAAAG